MHDVLVVGIPLLAIVAGILFNRQDSREIREEIREIRQELSALKTEMQKEFREFYATQRIHDYRLENLEQSKKGEK
jgi:hypothetical protein